MKISHIYCNVDMIVYSLAQFIVSLCGVVTRVSKFLYGFNILMIQYFFESFLIYERNKFVFGPSIFTIFWIRFLYFIWNQIFVLSF